MRVLRYREFRLLFAGQFVSLFGDGLFAVALSFAVLDETNSKAGLAAVLAAGSVPVVAFVLIGGVWADRLSRRRVMLAADGVRMAIQGVLALLVVTGHAPLAVFVGLYVLYGLAMAFFQPAATGLIPQTLPPEELQRANGLLGTARSVTAVAGGALGGVLVDVVGPGSAIGLDAVTFAVSVAALAAMRVGVTAVAAERESFAHDLSVGFREVRSRRWVWMTILNASLFLMVYVAPFDVVGPIVSRASLGGALAWGAISASFAGGMAAGGLLMMRVTMRRPMVVAGGLFLVTSLSPVLLAIPVNVGLICAAYVADGVGVGIYLATWETALQRQIPERVLSRVSAWDWMGSLAGLPLGYALTAPLLAVVGESAVLYGSAGCAVLLTVWMLGIPDIRRIGERAVSVLPSERAIQESASADS
jgi:MFS family permease